MAPAASPMVTISTTSIHVCPYQNCRKSFSKKYNLKAHLRMHTGEMPFVCPRSNCSKKFKWRSSLSSHTVWHERQDGGNFTDDGDTTKEKKNRLGKGTQPSVEKFGVGGNVEGKNACLRKKRPRVITDQQSENRVTSPATVESEVALVITGKRSAGQTPAIAPLQLQMSLDQAVPSKKRKVQVDSPGSVSSRESMNMIFDTKSCGMLQSVSHAKHDGPQYEEKPLSALSSPLPLIDQPAVPGSPVTSDRDSDPSEASLDSLSFFESLGDDVYNDTSIVAHPFAKDDVLLSPGVLAQCASPGCTNINPLDKSFKDFELESLRSFYAKEDAE